MIHIYKVVPEQTKISKGQVALCGFVLKRTKTIPKSEKLKTVCVKCAKQSRLYSQPINW